MWIRGVWEARDVILECVLDLAGYMYRTLAYDHAWDIGGDIPITQTTQTVFLITIFFFQNCTLLHQCCCFFSYYSHIHGVLNKKGTKIIIQMIFDILSIYFENNQYIQHTITDVS